MGLVMLTVLLVVTYVVYMSLNKPDPPASMCIVVPKDSWNPKVNTTHVLMEVSDFADENFKNKCSVKLDCWGIAALADGKLDGPCYGSVITKGNHLNCDYIGTLLLKDRGSSNPKPYNFDAKCPGTKDSETLDESST